MESNFMPLNHLTWSETLFLLNFFQWHLQLLKHCFFFAGQNKVCWGIGAILLSVEENWTAWCICQQKQNWEKEICSTPWNNVSFHSFHVEIGS